MPRSRNDRWISARTARWLSASAQMISSVCASGRCRDGTAADAAADGSARPLLWRAAAQGGFMDDNQVLHRIHDLAAEEEKLWSAASAEGGLSTEEQNRLQELQVQLDQAYDLLNQRRARRSAGL